MESGRFEEIREIVVTALRHPDSDRASYLDQACAGDPDLRREVESLLSIPESADGLASTGITPRLTESLTAGAAREPAPDRIGPYRIVGTLGEGGMGIVYRAEQSEPVRRTVALKVIRADLASRGIVARFEAERQALALMQHPNIAQVFDGGVTEQGAPYFAMELVAGQPITRFCDERRLGLRERLEILLQVCQGVEHAHQRGIIHRDLKPSNVLVGEAGVPKIIDFGIAKAIAEPLTDAGHATQIGAMLGTPQYMSPEQADPSVADIDTRSDVFALGLMLYQLLTGRHPLDQAILERGNTGEIRDHMCRAEFPTPSRRVVADRTATAAGGGMGGTDRGNLARRLRADLDWITMRALDRDRARRYGSPRELADDIRRHLTHQPVLAGPPSVVYRMRKFARRHSLGVALTGFAAIFLVVFMVAMSMQSRRIAREHESAERAAEFLARMLSDVDPEKMGVSLRQDIRRRIADARTNDGASPEEVERNLATIDALFRGVNMTSTASSLLESQILAPAGETIRLEAADDPLFAARLLGTLGETQRHLGLDQRAEVDLKAAEELWSSHAPGSRDAFESRANLARIYLNINQRQETERIAREALPAVEKRLGRDDLVTLKMKRYLALARFEDSDYEEAEAIDLEILDALRRTSRDGEDLFVDVTAELGNVYLKAGRYDDAERLHREALDLRRRRLGDEHTETVACIINLAYARAMKGDVVDAAAGFEEALRIRRKTLGDDHPRTLRAAYNLSVAYRQLGRYREAAALARRVLESRIRLLGPDHPNSLNARSALVDIAIELGHLSAAAAEQADINDVLRRTLGPEHARTLDGEFELAGIRLKQGRLAEADRLASRVLETDTRVLRENHPMTLLATNLLVTVRAKRGQLEGLREKVRGLLAAWATVIDESPDDHDTLDRYARLLADGPIVDLRNNERALDLALRLNEATGYRVPKYLDTLALAYQGMGRTEEAAATERQALERLSPEADHTEFEARLAQYRAAPGH